MAGLQPVIENIVDGKVQLGEMFTAHDITLEARSKSHKAGHNEVKDIVHDYYQRGGMGVAYTRTSITVPLGGTPFLYHRSADDPASYGNIRGVGQVPTAPTSTISIPNFAGNSISTTDDEDEDDDEDDGSSATASLLSSVAGVAVATKRTAGNANKVSGRTPDARQTLSIPTALIRKAGFQPKQTAYVSVVGNTLEITSQPVGTGSKYTVDDHSQIRITQYCLDRAGIGGATYDIEGDAGKIIVKKH